MCCHDDFFKQPTEIIFKWTDLYVDRKELNRRIQNYMQNFTSTNASPMRCDQSTKNVIFFISTPSAVNGHGWPTIVSLERWGHTDTSQHWLRWFAMSYTWKYITLASNDFPSIVIPIYWNWRWNFSKNRFFVHVYTQMRPLENNSDSIQRTKYKFPQIAIERRKMFSKFDPVCWNLKRSIYTILESKDLSNNFF